MTRGQRYRLVRKFSDLDGSVHQPGAEWFFVGSAYGHYDDILSIFVADDDWNEWCIQMRWDRVASDFKEFIKAIPGFREEYFATARCVECGAPLELSRPAYCPQCHLVWDPA